MFSTGNVLPVKIQPPLLRPLAYRVLSKKYGLNIKSDGLSTLADFVGKSFGIDWKKNNVTLQFLEKFALIWKQQERGVFIDEQGVKDVVSEMRERDKASSAPITGAKIVEQEDGENLSKITTKHKQSTIDRLVSHGESSPAPAAQGELADADVLQGVSPLPVPIEDTSEQESSGVQEEELDWRSYFKVINASEQPKYSYDPRKLQFVFTPGLQSTANELHKFKLPDIDSDLSIFSTRFYLIRDRIQRNENFQQSDSFNPLSSIITMQQDLTKSEDLAKLSASMSITQIKNLAGRDGQNFLLLGLLCKNSKGCWSLEDPSGTVEIDISQAVPTKGLYYVPGCIVLVEGIYFTVGNKFHVSSMTHPPGEKRDETLEAIGNLDLLGIHGSLNSNFVPRLDKDLKIRLHLLEKELVDHRFIFLGGDIFLDQMPTISALRKVFTKLEEDPPNFLVFHGSFSAVPVHASMSSRNISSTSQYKNNFDRLAKLFTEFGNVAENSTIILIPGANDPWGSMVSLGAANVWPLQPIPHSFVQKLKKVCKTVILASNPTRVAYLSQEIAIVRDDITDRLKRHSVSFPVEETAESEANLEAERKYEKSSQEEVSINQIILDRDQLPARIRQSRKLVKTLLDQGQISPFVPSIRPLVWNLDQALSMYPIPSTLILCDTTAPQFDVTYNGCKAINPGKFIVDRKARYIEYRPSMKRASQKEIPF